MLPGIIQVYDGASGACPGPTLPHPSRPLRCRMPLTPHIEKHFLASALVPAPPIELAVCWNIKPTIAAAMLIVATPAKAADTKVAPPFCEITIITRIWKGCSYEESNAKNLLGERPPPDGRYECSGATGSAILYENGKRQASYYFEPQIAASRIGDHVELCLVQIPDCSAQAWDDNRGKVYAVKNLRSGGKWELPDSIHMCGGARRGCLIASSSLCPKLDGGGVELLNRGGSGCHGQSRGCHPISCAPSAPPKPHIQDLAI
jgi:hypothetical protein